MTPAARGALVIPAGLSDALLCQGKSIATMSVAGLCLPGCCSGRSGGAAARPGQARALSHRCTSSAGVSARRPTRKGKEVRCWLTARGWRPHAAFFIFFSISTFKLTPCAHNPYGSPWGACARCPRTGRAHLAQGHELADVVVAPRQLGVFEVGQDLARPLRRLRPHALCVSVSRLRMGLYCMWACLACAL